MSDRTEIDGVAELAKDELLREIRRDRSTWEALLAEAGDRTAEPGAAGEWNLRDVLAHVTAYHRFLVGTLGGEVRTFDDMPEEIGMDLEARNQWMHQQSLGMAWDEVVREADAVRDELERQIERRTDDQLREQLVPWQEWPIWRWVVDLTRGHTEQHHGDLRAWLDRTS